MKFKYIAGILVLGLAFIGQAEIQDIKDAPDGVTVNIGDDGGVQVISVGTGTYDFNDADSRLEARKEAEKNAKVAIVKFLKEDMATEESASKMVSSVKKLSSKGGKKSAEVDQTTAKQALSSVRSSSAALLTGVVVLADEKVPEADGEGGTVRVMIGVSSKTAQAASNAGNAMTDSIANRKEHEAVTVQGGGASSSGTAASGDNTLPASQSGLASSGSADGLPQGWIECVGVGSDRKSAVQQALVDGISQVYGQVLQNDERMSERMQKFKVNANILGKKMSAVSQTTSKERESCTLTKTAGFVREYRVVKVIPKDGNQEATVHAYIVNPRAGGTVALMVCKPTMTIEDRTTVYQLGPNKRLSGAEVAKVVQFALPNGLAKANKFLILNDKSVDAVVENKTATDAMVAAGLAGQQELMQVGQGLTPDYSLRTEITDIKYSKKLGQDKKTKKFGQVYKMTIKLNVTLMNDRTGQAVKSDIVTVALDNDEIKGLLEENENADLLEAAMSKLADPIEQWIKK